MKKEMENLSQELESTKFQLKDQPDKTQEVINREINRIEEERKPRIEEFERKRRFILDKLPFIK
jgi:hypothetical protein